MTPTNESDRTTRLKTGRVPKKTYTKPAVRFERVFETSALTCGKVQTTQSGCHSNRKTS